MDKTKIIRIIGGVGLAAGSVGYFIYGEVLLGAILGFAALVIIASMFFKTSKQQ